MFYGICCFWRYGEERRKRRNLQILFGEIKLANYRANDVIRLTRKAVGLSQEAISEGICSVETFSRIERGKTKIKGDTYKKTYGASGNETQTSSMQCVVGKMLICWMMWLQLKMRLQSLIISLLIRFWECEGEHWRYTGK